MSRKTNKVTLDVDDKIAGFVVVVCKYTKTSELICGMVFKATHNHG